LEDFQVVQVDSAAAGEAEMATSAALAAIPVPMVTEMDLRNFKIFPQFGEFFADEIRPGPWPTISALNLTSARSSCGKKSIKGSLIFWLIPLLSSYVTRAQLMA
jgi:hypothetical protein